MAKSFCHHHSPFVLLKSDVFIENSVLCYFATLLPEKEVKKNVRMRWSGTGTGTGTQDNSPVFHFLRDFPLGYHAYLTHSCPKFWIKITQEVQKPKPRTSSEKNVFSPIRVFFAIIWQLLLTKVAC